MSKQKKKHPQRKKQTAPVQPAPAAARKRRPWLIPVILVIIFAVIIAGAFAWKSYWQSAFATRVLEAPKTLYYALMTVKDENEQQGLEPLLPSGTYTMYCEADDKGFIYMESEDGTTVNMKVPLVAIYCDNQSFEGKRTYFRVDMENGEPVQIIACRRDILHGDVQPDTNRDYAPPELTMEEFYLKTFTGCYPR